MSVSINRQTSKRPSVIAPLAVSPPLNENVVVGGPNQELVNQNLRTRRTKCILNFALEDFTRIHAQFSDKNKAAFIETPVYSFHENEKIKFQLRLHPSKHSLNIDALYKGNEPSAQLFMDIYLLDSYGRKHNFEFGRKVECQLSAQNPENLGNFIYDRDDLEKKRDKLFNGDKLVIALEVSATWIDVSESIGNIAE